MLDLHISGRPLLLPAGTTASVEHLNPLFADGIEDSFSLPLELPVEGNEIALGHVHELALASRALSLRDATLGEKGVPLFPGTLQVLATTPQVVRSSFSVQGLASLLNGVMLRDLLQGTLVDLDADEALGYRFHDRPLYAAGGNCQFPMHLNRQLYGSENPDWYPNASAYNGSSSYSVNALVEYTTADVVERTGIWQCISAAGPGESPDTAPAKWRLTAFGLVNAWNKAEGAHYLNTTENFYALVPWFYLKWVLLQALAALGLRVEGEFMDDAATNEELLPNSTTIDQAGRIDTDHYLRVYQSTPAPLPGSGTAKIPADTESPAPYSDTAGLWATDTFTPDAAGTWRVRIRLKYNYVALGTSFARAYVVGPTSPVDIRAIQTRPLSGLYGNVPVVFIMSFTVAPGDVGQPFFFYADQSNQTLPAALSTWGNGDNGDEVYDEVDITAWLETSTDLIQPDSFIYPERHVPDMELGAFLVAVADAYCLEVVPDLNAGTVRLDYRNTVATSSPDSVTDQTHRASGTPELDHQRTITGFRMAWDLPTLDDPYGDLDTLPEYDSEQDLTAPLVIGERCLIRNTRKVMSAVLNPDLGLLAWRHVGYHVPAYLVGQEDGAREVLPACAPLHMDQVQMDSETYLVPVLDQSGTSAWYGTTGEQEAFHLCTYQPMDSEDGSVTDVPSARSWGVGWDSSDVAPLNHLWDTEAGVDGMAQRFWGAWANLLVNAEPVTWDLIADLPFLLGPEWRRIIHLHGQHYLIERLPIEHGSGSDRFLSQGAYLYRLRS